MHHRPQAQAASQIGDRVKLHRRRIRAGGRDYTVISPRPGTDIRFSTNFYHETWHVLSDWRGARMLGRLMWGLVYARVPGTLIVIDREFLDTDPFDGEPSRPIMLVPAWLTPVNQKVAAEIRRACSRTRPDGTVRWLTHGIEAAAEERNRTKHPGEYRPPYRSPRGIERVELLGGCLAITASPEQLRDTATCVYTLCENEHDENSYTQVGYPDGEVQVFRDYRQRVSATMAARRRIEARPDAPETLEEMRPLIWHRSELIRKAAVRRAARRAAARRAATARTRRADMTAGT